MASKIKHLREKRGLTLRDVERDTGISNAYLSQLESGHAQNPTLKKVRRLATYFGVCIGDLFPEPPVQIAFPPDGIRMFYVGGLRTWLDHEGEVIDTEPEEQSPYLHMPDASGYPYLAMDEYEFFVVLFVAPRTGILLYSGKVGGLSPGAWSTTWEEEEFYAVPITLTIEQVGDPCSLGPRARSV